MTVVCKVVLCPYRSAEGFCRKKVLGIHANGACGYLYKRNGQVNQKYQEKKDERSMESYVIEDAAAGL